MAGVSTKEIRSRIRSMESTKQITKAMEMVASSKLRKAHSQVLTTRPYFQILSSTMEDIVENSREFSSPFLHPRPVEKVLYIVIAGDRGLAGGYNHNILKMVLAQMQDSDVIVLPIGKKALEYFQGNHAKLFTSSYSKAEDMGVEECFSIARVLRNGYLNGDFDEVHIAYTRYVSALSQIPDTKKLLPLTQEGFGKANSRHSEIIYEPDAQSVFHAIVPEYLGGILYGALCESRAAEQAARRIAMEAATSNAEERIGNLRIKYNQARQSAITQEITEIVAGL